MDRDKPEVTHVESKYLEKYLEKGREPSLGLQQMLRHLRHVLIQSAGEFHSLDSAARELGMSGRSLRRQLHTWGTSFQHELDDVRKDLAIRYLTQSDKCFTEIAFNLGFCDSSAFSKAFKKWTGMSPRAFKKHYTDQFNQARAGLKNVGNANSPKPPQPETESA